MTLEEQEVFKQHLTTVGVTGCMQLATDLQTEALSVFQRMGIESTGQAVIVNTGSQAHTLLLEINSKLHIVLTFLFINQSLKLELAGELLPEISETMLIAYGDGSCNPLGVTRKPLEVVRRDGSLGND